jgi:hypothetical protein
MKRPWLPRSIPLTDMSLKAFHIVFVCCSTLLAFGFGAWCVVQFFDKRGGLYLLAGVGSVGAGAALIRYGILIYRKLKDVPWM